MNTSNFHGIFPAVVTPFDEHENFAPAAFEQLIERLYAAGIDGLYVNGHTGEGFQQPVEQRKRVAEVALHSTPKGKSVILHVGAGRTADAVELARHAATIGVQAISSLLPLYLYERFRMTLTSAGFSATFYIQAASFAGILIGGLAADYWGTRCLKGRIWVQSAGLAAAAPFLFLIGVASSQALLIVALLTFGVGSGIYDSNAVPVLCQIAPAQFRSTGYGVFNLVSCIVGGITAAAAGYLKSAIGLGFAFQVAAAILIAAALILLTVRPKPVMSKNSIE